MTHIGTMFHETLAFNRPAVAQIIALASDSSFKLTRTSLRERTNLGKNYIKAMPPYAVGAGLLSAKDRSLTVFGKAVFEYDPDLNHPATLWLIHYHLSAFKGPGPAFWHHLTMQFLHMGMQVKRSELAEELDTFLKSNDSAIGEESLSSTVGVFTGTYAKHGLEGLKLLQELEQSIERKPQREQDKLFQVGEPDAPPTFALGYALAHYWEQEVSALRTDLADLSKPGGFAGLFFLGSYGLNAALRELQREGFLELEQIAPPHQIVRQWKNKEAFLGRLYE